MLKTLTFILKPYKRHISDWGMREAFFISVLGHAAFLIILLLNFSFLPKVFNKEKLILLDDVQVATTNNLIFKSQLGSEVKYRDISNSSLIDEPKPPIKIEPQVFSTKKDEPAPLDSPPPEPLPDKPSVIIKEVKPKPTIPPQEVPAAEEKTEKKPPTTTDKLISKSGAESISSKLLKHKPAIETATSEEPQVASLLKSAQLKKNLKSGSAGSSTEGAQGLGPNKFTKELPLSADIITAIKTQFIRCWVVPIGLQDLEHFSIVISLNLDQKGNILNAAVLKDAKYISHPTYQALADSALRAVYRCSPLKGLPLSHYLEWKEMELTFDPKEML